eukprot:gene16870-20042_t
MLQWWFTYCDASYKYRLWHPDDHVWCTWNEEYTASPVQERKAFHEVNNSHIVTEHLGKAFGHPVEDLHIDFRCPSEYGFTASTCAAAGVQFIVTARPHTANDRSLGHAAAGHMIHIARELPDGSGLELRSRFWVGKGARKLDCGLPPAFLVNMVSQFAFVKSLLLPLSMGLQVFRHASEEFRCLAEILPALFEQEAAPHWKNVSEAEHKVMK